MGGISSLQKSYSPVLFFSVLSLVLMPLQILSLLQHLKISLLETWLLNSTDTHSNCTISLLHSFHFQSYLCSNKSEHIHESQEYITMYR